ncbi:MAG: CPXCG motif-containing cysteine-rich protein [Gemmatimonadales bacterium]|nr:CPXCG motif-containing cysteine-rich protein [Gemmatimonadales bacterium]
MRDRDEHEDGGEGEEGGDGEDGALQEEAVIHCPHCGEELEIQLDPGGGTHQEYVEDCQVCCQPMQIQVSYNNRGVADVKVGEEG